MDLLASGVLVASLTGSLHCAGMCGGLVAVYAGQTNASRTGHISYSLGRLSAYVTLGAIAGAVGAVVDLAGDFAGWQRTASWVAGAMIVIWGVHSLLAALKLELPHLSAPRFLRRRWGALIARAAQRGPIARSFLVGLLSALLPCGWLWIFVVTAAGTGSAWRGALTMSIFWIGTLPVMLLVGVAVGRLAEPLRRRLPIAAALLLIAVGLMAVSGRSRITLSPDASLAAGPSCHGRH